MNIARTTLLHDLIAQRAKAQATIADLTRKAGSDPDPVARGLWASMLRQYIDSMPGIDGQIAALRA